MQYICYIQQLICYVAIHPPIILCKYDTQAVNLDKRILNKICMFMVTVICLDNTIGFITHLINMHTDLLIPVQRQCLFVPY